MEELSTLSTDKEGAEGATATRVGEVKKVSKDREKEVQTKKVTEIDAKALGLQIFTAESLPFPRQVTYEMLMEGIKAGNYKYIFSAKKTDQEILQMIEKKKVKIF